MDTIATTASNIPHVLSGGALTRLTDALEAAFLGGVVEAADYAYYPRAWRSPYIERRRETGWGLYALAGVERGDHEAGRRQRARNYRFFGAPVGLIFLIDRDLERGSWLDFGMFLQSIMVAARGRGLDTISQQSIANYPAIVGQHIPVPAGSLILCGMALGYSDPDEPANRLVTRREPLDQFASFHSD